VHHTPVETLTLLALAAKDRLMGRRAAARRAA